MKAINDRYSVTEDGRVWSVWKQDYLRPMKTGNGYCHVCIHKHYFKIHRLVAQAYLPNPENKPQVNHIDGNKSNNHVSNLEWVTALENMQHALRVLKQNRNIGKQKLDKETVYKIRELRVEGVSIAQIARDLGIARHFVQDVLRGHSYATI